jgi:protein-disulfide isomerase
MAHQQKTEGVPVPTVVISVIAVFVAGLLIGGFVLRFGSKGDKECDCPGTAARAAAGVERYRIYPRPHNPSQGPRTALVTIIEASDFQCPHCARAVRTMKQIRKAYPKQVRLVFMHNPLPSHRDARLAAVAAQAAKKQGKFWPYHELLFKNPKQLKKPHLIKYAKKVGMNVAKFKKDLANKRLHLQVRQDQQQLKRVGARSTPSFFINGRYVRGGRSFAQFKKIIDQEIQHARKLVKSGVARGQLYRNIMKTAKFRIGGKKKQADKRGRKKRKRRREDPNAVYKVDIKGRPYKGAKNAKVVIAEWSEFQCPWCKRTNPLFEKLLKKFPNDVKLVWFDFPLRFHKQAMPAAIAAWEVFQQKGNKAFWAFHDKVFANNRNITTENLAKWAKEVGANPKKVTAAVKEKKHQKVVRASMRAGQKIGVRGTPTVIINGKKYRGRRDPDTVAAVIKAQIDKANKTIGKGGVTAANYYAHIQKKALNRVKYLPGSKGKRRGKRRKRKRLDPNAIYKVEVSPKDVGKGPKNALVTIVEWSDFQCPYCKWAACIADHITEAYPKDVRLVFRHNPLRFHRQAMPAAEAAMAAWAQKGDKGFWAMHDKLFPTEKCSKKPPMPHIRKWLRALPRPAPKMDMELFTKYAKELGLNLAQFKKDMESHKFQKMIKEQQAIAVKLGARGTPAFFINGKYVRGIRPFATMKKMIDREIAAAKKLMAEKKIPRAKVYQTIIAKGATSPVYLDDKKGNKKPAIRIRRGRGKAKGKGKRRVIRVKPRAAMK